MPLSTLELKLNSSYPNLSSGQKKLILKKIKERLISHKKVGKGFLSNLVSKVKSVGKKAVSVVKDVGKKVVSKAVEVGLDKLHSNTNKDCSNSNSSWVNHPLPGEKHQVLHNNGCSYRARFSGPGTRVLEDIKTLLKVHNNDLSKALAETSFASAVDIEAFAHDLRYMLSNGSKEKVREADQKFISVLSHMTDPNRLIPLAAMKAKVAAEDYKLVEVYGSEANHFSAEDKKLMEDILSRLEKRGYGIEGNTGPVGYPIPGGPAYPPHYFSQYSYPYPELGMNRHPDPNRPLRTIPYSVDPRLTAEGLEIHHGGSAMTAQDTPWLYDVKLSHTPNPGPINFEGKVVGSQFISSNKEGRYIASGVPLKDSLHYKPLDTTDLVYSVPIEMTSGPPSYTGKGIKGESEECKRGTGDQVNPLLTGAGVTLRKPRNPRKLETKPRKKSLWTAFAQYVSKRDKITLPMAIKTCSAEYKKCKAEGTLPVSI